MKALLLTVVLFVASCSAPAKKPEPVAKPVRPISPYSDSILKALIIIAAEKKGLEHKTINTLKCMPDRSFGKLEGDIELINVEQAPELSP